jgi:hypothetical protein
MAVKPFRIILLALILILAGIATIKIVRSRLSIARQMDNERFVKTYVELSTAREKFSSDPDSLRIMYNRIFEENGTDSAWEHKYAETLSSDLTIGRKVWSKIVSRLDSLKPGPDSLASN